MAGSPTILFQPPNHIGLGHINRLSAIALALREIDESIRTPFVVEGVGHVLLDSLALPYVPLPSSHAMMETECWAPWAENERSSLMLEVSRAIIRSFEPNIVVFDCFPAPSMVSAVRECNIPVVLCLREMRKLQEYLDYVLDLLPEVELILIPHESDAFDLPHYLNAKSYFVGSIVRPNLASASDCSSKRNYKRVIVTGGGGGYPGTAAFYNLATRAVAESRTLDAQLECHLITGPLFNEWLELKLPYNVTVIPFESNLSSTLAAADLVICQAGYNTVSELEHLGTKTILVPAERQWDDQFARARRMSEQSAQFREFCGAGSENLAQLIQEFLKCSSFASPPIQKRGAYRAAERLQMILENVGLR